jgi:hypothetical protein
MELSENPITEPGPMIRWTIQFPEGDLEKLRDLQRQTRINGRDWMGALLAALVEYHEATMPNEQDYYRTEKAHSNKSKMRNGYRAFRRPGFGLDTAWCIIRYIS